MIPCGLVARIRRFHRRGRGSIPRKGGSTFFDVFSEKQSMYSVDSAWTWLPWRPVSNEREGERKWLDDNEFSFSTHAFLKSEVVSKFCDPVWSSG